MPLVTKHGSTPSYYGGALGAGMRPFGSGLRPFGYGAMAFLGARDMPMQKPVVFGEWITPSYSFTHPSYYGGKPFWETRFGSWLKKLWGKAKPHIKKGVQWAVKEYGPKALQSAQSAVVSAADRIASKLPSSLQSAYNEKIKSRLQQTLSDKASQALQAAQSRIAGMGMRRKRKSPSSRKMPKRRKVKRVKLTNLSSAATGRGLVTMRNF